MKKRLYVDFHVLQTVPPSCINRDDTGSPKTAMYGGVLRARVSSQAWKHAMRKDFAENTPLDVGKRTKKAAELVKEQILALDPEQKKADKMAKDALKHVNITSNDKKGTDALVFISSAQAKALAELAVEGCTNDEKYEEAMIKNPSADMVLFGRMVAQKASLKYDAAAQVAHSISTHAVKNEYDYFTAVDDCQTDSTGAGHLGTVEYNSSTLYRYATVNVMELAGQLGAAQ
ncbi:MAG TPA: type I-E CRISPR-associated protein Cas7/Cse4/CasC, partial [Faecalibacterium sp.]|nr:type I-E CRISPR-associated protein Cas7/Cse4/CasC [Faecalibacterium sp.]